MKVCFIVKQNMTKCGFGAVVHLAQRPLVASSAVRDSAAKRLCGWLLRSHNDRAGCRPDAVPSTLTDLSGLSQYFVAGVQCPGYGARGRAGSMGLEPLPQFPSLLPTLALGQQLLTQTPPPASPCGEDGGGVGWGGGSQLVGLQGGHCGWRNQLSSDKFLSWMQKYSLAVDGQLPYLNRRTDHRERPTKGLERSCTATGSSSQTGSALRDFPQVTLVSTLTMLIRTQISR